MVASNSKSKMLSSYEELRQQRLDDNKKRMEELNLTQLSQSLNNSSPMKRTITKPPRIIRTEMVIVRRSSRVANNPAPVYKEIVISERINFPRRSYNKRRDLSGRVYASDEARARATLKAEELELSLGSDYPTMVKPMLQSHVTGGFWLQVFKIFNSKQKLVSILGEWVGSPPFYVSPSDYLAKPYSIYLGLPRYFCRKNLPRRDDTITLVDEDGEEYPTVYLVQKNGLSGGWRGFSIDHELVDGDALVFQLIRPTVFKVFIIRVNGSDEGVDLEA